LRQKILPLVKEVKREEQIWKLRFFLVLFNEPDLKTLRKLAAYH
jgi:hypothetical protein